MKPIIKIAPSILSADFSCLGEEIRRVESAGADMIHIDVMDGHFVPNITMGPLIVKAIRKITSIPLDVHLMIENPEKYISSFADAGSSIISFHAEAAPDPERAILKIKESGNKPAIAINPDSDFSHLEYLLPKIDMVLLMSVFPGFAGQKFIPSVLSKISLLRELINKHGLSVDIEVDGGINPDTAKDVIRAGANVLVVGSALFCSEDYASTIGAIKNSYAKE